MSGRPGTRHERDTHSYTHTSTHTRQQGRSRKRKSGKYLLTQHKRRVLDTYWKQKQEEKERHARKEPQTGGKREARGGQLKEQGERLRSVNEKPTRDRINVLFADRKNP